MTSVSYQCRQHETKRHSYLDITANDIFTKYFILFSVCDCHQLCFNNCLFRWSWWVSQFNIMCGMKLQDRVQSKELRERLGLDNIISELQQNRLRWYGHVLRIEDNDWVKKCMEYEVEGARSRGRPKKSWRKIVEKDYKLRGLNREDAMDRSRQRKQTGIFYDHNGCEWVNVSSGTGLPGLSRTKSKEL